MARLAILLPVYKAETEQFLASLTSVVIAAPADTEIVIGLDGPCPEDIYRVIDLSRHARPTLEITTLELVHAGLARTLNTMIEHCDSQWIARQDADDYTLPTRFTQQIRALEEQPGYTFCGTQITRCGNGLRPNKRQRNYPTTFKQQLLYASCLNNPIAHPTLLLSRSKLGDIRYQDKTGVEDWQLYTDLWNHGHRSFNLKTSELLYRVHPKQITASTRSWREVEQLKQESLRAALRENKNGFGLKLLYKASKALHLSEALISNKRAYG